MSVLNLMFVGVNVFFGVYGILRDPPFNSLTIALSFAAAAICAVIGSVK